MSKHHTPGPWMVVDDHPDKACYYIQDKNHLDEIATIYRYERNPCDTLADARLIAAAPDLLKALEGIAALLEQLGFVSDASLTVGAARAAIAKAKGEEQ